MTYFILNNPLKLIMLFDSSLPITSVLLSQSWYFHFYFALGWFGENVDVFSIKQDFTDLCVHKRVLKGLQFDFIMGYRTEN